MKQTDLTPIGKIYLKSMIKRGKTKKESLKELEEAQIKHNDAINKLFFEEVENAYKELNI